MELKKRIEKLKTEMLKRIEEAAKEGDTKTILSNTKIVEEVERLMRRWEEINCSVDVLEKKANSILKNEDVSIHFIENELDTIEAERLSPKKKGRARRNALVQELKTIGIPLTSVGGTSYKTKSGSLVGIAYASERLPNRWFLGMPSKYYSSVVLICERKSADLLNFVLPKDFIYRNLDKLSHDDNGQVKFNIFFRGESYQLRIPSEGYESIDSFKENYTPLSL